MRSPFLNLRALATAACTLAAGLALFWWVQGPVRGLFGDVLIIVFGVSCLAAVGLFSAPWRVGGMLGLGVVAEGFQALDLVGPDSHWLLHLTVGSTPDPVGPRGLRDRRCGGVGLRAVVGLTDHLARPPQVPIGTCREPN